MKNRITNYLLRHLLNAVVLDDIITTDKMGIKIGGKPVTDTELRSLVAEVKALQGFRIWSIFTETLKNEAMDRGFNKSVTYQDLHTCKLMLYNVTIFESICNLIRSKEK